MPRWLLAFLLGVPFASVAQNITLPGDEPTSSKPDYCQDGGPVSITLHDTVECPRSLVCTVYGNKDDGYRESCSQNTNLCTKPRYEVWTNYPECGGEKMEEIDMGWHQNGCPEHYEPKCYALSGHCVCAPVARN